MSGSTRTSQGLDPRRRRALVRAWRRGTREMDLILGRFADAHIGALSDRDLADLELLLDMPDQDVFDWITGARPVATPYASPLFRSIVAFHAQRHDPT
ncbi:MAG: succinate dehydrogenase assembly factor 2 [Propylenella sp.]